MKTSLLKILTTIAISFAVATTATANTVYSNGSISGTLSANTINEGFSVSDSFTLTEPTKLTDVELGLWTYHDSTPTSVNWSIGSSAFSSDLGNGTTSLTNSFYKIFNIYDVSSSVFSIDILLQAGHYWFSLENAVASDGRAVFWDMSRGPSLAFQQSVEAGTYSTFSHFFALSSNSEVPEPTTVALLGLGLLGFAASRRKSTKSMSA